MRLSEALALGESEIVAIVGGGGKTTVMYRLAREAAADGGRAIATGTTLFTPPPDGRKHAAVVDADPERLIGAVAAALEHEQVVIAATGHGTQGRFLPVSPETVARLAALPGVGRVVVEADGSRTRPFKAPAEHEPVIPASATLVIAVAGMSVLGQPLDDAHVHRPECVAALTGAELGAPVTAEMMVSVLAHPLGGRKGVPAGCRHIVLLNQVEEKRIDAARRLARLLIEAGIERVVLARAREEPPVVEVVVRGG